MKQDLLQLLFTR